MEESSNMTEYTLDEIKLAFNHAFEKETKQGYLVNIVQSKDFSESKVSPLTIQLDQSTSSSDFHLLWLVRVETSVRRGHQSGNHFPQTSHHRGSIAGN